MRFHHRLLFIVAFVFGFSNSTQAQTASELGYQANPAKEFIMSCTYGVLAGTLVGGALLAFEDQPGDNLNKVARGASLGLYAGILLGLYVVYIVPEDDEEDLDPYNQPGLPPLEGEGQIRKDLYQPSKTQFQAGLAPTLNLENNMDGASAVFQWRFF